jgi:hypothetical protein
VTTTVFTPSISELSHFDANGNGQLDPGEIGLANATITLYRDGGNGVFDGPPTDPQIGAAITTSASGDWAFTSGMASNNTYFVVQHESERVHIRLTQLRRP